MERETCNHCGAVIPSSSERFFWRSRYGSRAEGQGADFAVRVTTGEEHEICRVLCQDCTFKLERVVRGGA